MKTPIATKTDGADRLKLQTQKETTGSLYIHVPFCTKKCPYCHFFVLPYDKTSVRTYIDTLKREWGLRRGELSSLVSIYFGGGTPSLLEPDELKEILEWTGKEAKEITLEANPETVTYARMKAYQELGINRVSIGVQSLEPGLLTTIGRTHSASKAVDAIYMTKAAGIDNISIDLMYDLPSQTFDSWKRTLDKAIELPITHLSLYNLTFEEGSSYFKHQKTLARQIPDDETSLHMLEYAVATLESAGLKRYEISAFCREGKISEHNVGYWTARPFIGIGPSAFSYQKGRRFRNVPHFKKWVTAIESEVSAADFEETLSETESLHELLAVRLRLVEGAPIDHLPEPSLEVLQDLSQEGFLLIKNNRATLTEKGRLFYDTVASQIV